MKKIALFSLIFLTLFSCRKDVNEETTTTNHQNPPVIDLTDFQHEIINVTASLAGVVLDEAGQPVVGATVTLNDFDSNVSNSTTDDRGTFVFSQVPMNAAGTFVLVEKAGYFNGSYRFLPKEGSQNYANIKMLAQTNIGTFASTSGGNVSSAEGIKISFPANSIITASGQLYDGNVNVAARWINPTGDDLSDVMPGNLQGVNRFNEEVAMATFGMMAVELTGDAGQELNIGNNLKAELTFPLPTEIESGAPDEIPLWYFNEDYGLWQEEGSATLVGDTYVGEVSHFSFWNCDAPFPLVYVSGTVVNENGVPVANAWVCASFTNSWGGTSTACGMTDNNGYFSGKMPEGEVLELTISQYGNCYMALVTNIGPFSVDTDLGNLEVTSPDLIEITGTVVDCNSLPLTNGWVSLTMGNQSSFYYLEGDNMVSTSMFNCDNATTLEVVGINLDDFEESDVLTYTVTPTIDLGEIEACGNSLDEYFIMTVNGESVTLVDVSGGSDSLSSFSVFAQMQNFQASLSLNENTVGTYDGSAVDFMYSVLEYPTQGILSQECGGLDCGVTEVIITEYGAVGEPIIGTFQGVGDFWDNTQQQVNLPFSGEFKVTRDY